MKKRILVVSLALSMFLVFTGIGLAANGDLTVSGTLTVNGALSLTTGTINVGSGGLKFPGGSTQTNASGLVWDYVVSAATKSVTSIPLDGHAHGGYEFEFIIYNPTASMLPYALYFNGDFNDSQIDSAWVNTAVPPAGSGPYTGGSMGNAQPGTYFLSQGNISISPSGHVFATYDVIRYASTGIHGTYRVSKYKVPVSNLTSISVLVGTGEVGIGANSRFRLWKRI